MSIDQRIVRATETLEADVKITSDVTHGDANTEIPTLGGPIPSLRKRLKDIETEWAKTADPLAEDLASAVQLTQGYRDDAGRSAQSAGEDATTATTKAGEASGSATSAAESESAAGDYRQQAQQAQEQSEAAKEQSEAAAIEAGTILEAVRTSIIPMATNLIRTQTIITEHHAFK